MMTTRMCIPLAIALAAVAPACSKKESDTGAGGSASASASAASTPAAPTDPAGKLLSSYLNASPDCASRINYILNPVGDRNAVAEYQKNGCASKYLSIDSSDCKSPDPTTGYCTAKVVWSKGKNAFGADVEDYTWYCLKQTDQGFKIDWRCSLGYGDMTLPAFMAQHQIKKPAVMRLIAKLDNYFNYEFMGHDKDFYSVNLEDQDGKHIHGYIPRKMPDAQKLYDTLKDGKDKHLVIELVYWPNSEDSSVALINRIFNLDGWQESPAEYTKG